MLFLSRLSCQRLHLNTFVLFLSYSVTPSPSLCTCLPLYPLSCWCELNDGGSVCPDLILSPSFSQSVLFSVCQNHNYLLSSVSTHSEYRGTWCWSMLTQLDDMNSHIVRTTDCADHSLFMKCGRLSLNHWHPSSLSEEQLVTKTEMLRKLDRRTEQKQQFRHCWPLCQQVKITWLMLHPEIQHALSSLKKCGHVNALLAANVLVKDSRWM